MYGLFFLFVTYIRPLLLHTTSSFTRLRSRGGFKGGCYTKGLREERRGGEKGWGGGEGVHALKVEVFVSVFDACVNESEKFSKKFLEFLVFNFFFHIFAPWMGRKEGF